jgi:hypothetical protein
MLGRRKSHLGEVERVISFLLAAWISAAQLRADLPIYDPSGWVHGSDVIVVATLIDVHVVHDEYFDSGSGVLEVREVLAGSLGPRDIEIEWTNPKTLACPRIVNEQHAGKEGIWFFHRTAEGGLNPAAIFLDLSDAAAVRQFDRHIATLPQSRRVCLVRRILEARST